MGTISATVARELVARAEEAFNAHDVEAFLQVLTDDVEIRHAASAVPLRGRDDVRSFYAGYMWTAFPDLRITLADGPFLHPDEAAMSLAWDAIGTHTGPLDPPGFAPTGRSFAVGLREIARLRGNRVEQLSIVLDMADVMRQLGMLPAAGSTGERALAGVQRLQAGARRLLTRR